VGGQLTIANCGDSRFVLGRRKDPSSALEHKDLSVDQNPNDPEEQKRIEK
jgi:serine/threonine protein phosphatase PrpC